MAYSFLRKEKIKLREQMTFIGKTMEIFIPSYFLKPNEKIADVISDKIETIGIFWFKVDNNFYEMQLPVKVQFEFSSSRKQKMRLQPSMPELEYTVFELKNGDAFIYDMNHKQDSDDLTFFISKLIEGAKLPETVSYEEVFNLFSRSLQITEINSRLGVPFLTIEFILSELFRDRKNNSKPFRMTYDGKRLSPYAYKMLRITKIPEVNSTFTSIIGEDIKQQLVSSILRNRTGKKDRVSPIEKVMKY